MIQFKDYLSIIFPQRKIIRFKSARVFYSKLNTPIQKVTYVVPAVKRRGLPCGIRVPSRKFFIGNGMRLLMVSVWIRCEYCLGKLQIIMLIWKKAYVLVDDQVVTLLT